MRALTDMCLHGVTSKASPLFLNALLAQKVCMHTALTLGAAMLHARGVG